MSHRILIIGAGQVGAALGLAWLNQGFDVRFGVPDPDNPRYADLPRDRLQAADVRGEADIIVLAVPYPAARAAILALGDLTGAVVIDCTNPLDLGPDGLGLSLGFDRSGAEAVAAWAVGASVFKTLNQTGAENLGRARAFQARPMMFVAGDDAARKPLVLDLVASLGFDAIDAGPLKAARLLEPLAMLWIALVTQRGHPRGFAFARTFDA